MENHLIPVIPFHKQIISYGEGSYVYDVDGKKYLDLNSGQFCTVLGHANADLLKCVSDISSKIVHTSSAMVSEYTVKVADMLYDISGEMKANSILLSTGAEAVEFAIRYAKHIKRREGIVCFEKGYHGLTLGTQSVTFGGKYACPMVNNVFSVSVPSDDNIGECLEQFKEIIRKNRDKIAAVIMEPIISVGGMIYPSATYFSEVKSVCKENDIFLIFDESQTGFARTGSWFYYQELNVVPDIVVCSKGIGMGYPISAVLFNEDIGKYNITMTHYSSHQNDPFAAAVVMFGIDYIKKNNILESNSKKGKLFLDMLINLCNKNDFYRNPRGYGMMLGLDLYKMGVDNYRSIYAELYEKAAASGVLLQGTDGGRVLRFLPDYLITDNDLKKCVKVLEEIKL